MVVGNRRAVYVYLPVGEVRDGSLQSCTTGTVCSEGKAGTTLFDLSDIRVTGDHLHFRWRWFSWHGCRILRLRYYPQVASRPHRPCGAVKWPKFALTCPEILQVQRDDRHDKRDG